MDQPDQYDGYGKQEPHALGESLEVGEEHRQPANGDLDAGIALAIDDRVDLRHDAAEAVWRVAGLCDDGTGAPIRRDEGIEVRGVGSDRSLQGVDLRRSGWRGVH